MERPVHVLPSRRVRQPGALAPDGGQLRPIGRRLLRILGRRAALGFGVVTLLVAAALATVSLTSRYALKRYVDDQLERIPWDVAVYRHDAGGDVGQLAQAASRVAGLARVATLAFLRVRLGEASPLVIEIDGKPLATPWLSMLAASDPSLLPPELAPALGRAPLGGAGPADRDEDGALAHDGSAEPSQPSALLALVGPERAMGGAFVALQGAKEITVRLATESPSRPPLALRVGRVVRLERDSLNRWLLDQTGSISYVPYIGVVVATGLQPSALARFDELAAAATAAAAQPTSETESSEATTGEYLPEVVILGRFDRARLISGWDIGSSLERVAAVNRRVRRATERAVLEEAGFVPPDPPANERSGEEASDLIAGFLVDSTTEVLLGRMRVVARLVGLIALLVALPLVWMGWVLAANLTSLLMLNERRRLGLLRLRGIAGALIGRILLVAIAGGGLVGGAAGLVGGSIGPLRLYERGAVPAGVLVAPGQMALLAGFFVVSLAVALLVGRRLVQYATRISPLEAAGRVTPSEAAEAALRFGPLQGSALLAGVYVLVVRWMTGGLAAAPPTWATSAWVRRALDFLGLPLFLYGLATLLAAHPRAVERVLAPLVRPVGGPLGRFALAQIAVKSHRTGAFLLIVALMTSVGLYPAIAGRSFADKAARGARVQLGADWQIVVNAPDLAEGAVLRGRLVDQVRALDPGLRRLVTRLEQLEGVRAATYLLEAVLPHFYLPDYGLKGVPMYLVGDLERYLAHAYWEPEVGASAHFARVLGPLADGAVAVSPPVAEFWRIEPGTPVLIGLAARREALLRPASGVVAHLPGIPPRSVSDRHGFVQARIEYLNYLFSHRGYLVGGAHDPHLADLQLLVPRIVLLVRTDPAFPPDKMRRALGEVLPVAPLEVHHLAEETAKIATDMFVSLALANLRIYLVGGVCLALVAVLAIALANYAEERRTLALLRIRGASPVQLWRLGLATVAAPALLGLTVGLVTALMAGFGLANYVWALRDVRTVIERLPTHLIVPPFIGWVLGGLLVVLVGLAAIFSAWVFRRTARERIQEA